MSLKYLSQFQRFDWDAFAAGKTFVYLGSAPWTDENGHRVGTKVEALITSDETKYTFREGDTRTNAFEKLTFKCSGAVPSLSEHEQIVPQGDVKGTIWGDYRNNLSVRCESISAVRSSK